MANLLEIKLTNQKKTFKNGQKLTIKFDCSLQTAEQ